MTTFTVSAGIIRHKGRILIAQRKSTSLFEKDRWEFPGGKVEFTEDPRATLKREIKEELDLTVSVGPVYEVASHIYEKDSKRYHLLLIAYIADYVSGEIKHIECQDSAWVLPEELKRYDFAAADWPIAEKIMKALKKIFLL